MKSKTSDFLSFSSNTSLVIFRVKLEAMAAKVSKDLQVRQVPKVCKAMNLTSMNSMKEKFENSGTN